MCLIALSDTGFEELTPDFWQSACAANQHGMGWMFHDGLQLWTHSQESYCPEAIAAAVASLPKGTRAAIHLRDSTFGARGSENLHPHLAHFPGERPLQLALMHNGSVAGLPAVPDTGPSDTALLLHTWIAPRMSARPHVWSEPDLLGQLAAFVGERNRLVLLDSTGAWRVIGEQEGFRVGGTWLSNPRARAWLSNPRARARL